MNFPTHVSVVMPCRDLSAELGSSIRAAQTSLAASGLGYEIVVVDWGSVDGSQRVAIEQAARVIAVPATGIGAAVTAGVEATAGAYIIAAVPDGVADFAEAARFLRTLDNGLDVVTGAGHSLRVLRLVNRLIFGMQVGDVSCRMVALRRDAARCFELQGLRANFAGEIATRAALAKLRVSEIPIGTAVNSGKAPITAVTKKAVQQELQLLLLYAPRWLFLYPGIILMMVGVLTPLVFPALDVFVFATGCLLIGLHACLFSVTAKLFEDRRGAIGMAPGSRGLLRYANLRNGLSAAAVLIGTGGIVLALGVSLDLETRRSFWLMLAAVMAVLVGIEAIFSSLFLRLLRLRGSGQPDAI